MIYSHVPVITNLLMVTLIIIIIFSTASGLINSVTPSSPKIGNRSIAFLNVTAKDANGEIGFSTAHQSVSVQEPVGPSSLFIELPVRRTGTADRVVVRWNITSVSATFYANDTGPQSGEVAFEKGSFACSYLKSSWYISTLGPNNFKIDHLGQVCALHTFFFYQTWYTALDFCPDHFKS